jgi:very-short-patch-repair endonuclease
MDWYRDGYTADGPEKWAQGPKPKLYQSTGSEWRLTTAERKRILLEHIYGVDIDPLAVEMTKLSLLLKVLEGESDETIGKQLQLFQERALPDLGRNIQCGNSLIGPDFYAGKQASLLDMEEQYRVNAFDWKKAFAEVMTSPPAPSPLHGEGETSAPAHSPLRTSPPAPSPLHGEGETSPLAYSPLRGEGGRRSAPGEVWRQLKPLARQMRREATEAEKALWERLRNRQVANCKFRRQHAIERFIVDFYCAEKDLVIEVDGPIHEYSPEEDAIRQNYLESLGLTVIRFTNERVISNLSSVIREIEAVIASTPSQRSGEGAGGEVGFDAVIGNPPYVRQEGLGAYKAYFQEKYQVYHGMADLYAYFIERGIELLKPKGMFGFIVANKWMRANYGQPLREWLKSYQLLEITDFGDLPVFERATTYPCILILKKEAPSEAIQVTNVHTLGFSSLAEYQEKNRFSLNQDSLADGVWSLTRQDEADLLEKLYSKGIALSEFVRGKVFYGIKTGLNEAFVIDAATRQAIIDQDPHSAELIKPFLIGREVKRYQPPESQQFLILIPKGWTRERSKLKSDPWRWLQKNYPAISHHLAPFAQKAEARYDKGEFWWELRACDYYAEFEKPKIIYPNISKKPEFTFDNSGIYTNQKCFIIPTESIYLLGVLNSKVTFFLYRKLLPKLRGDFYEPSYVFFKDFPIRSIDPTNPADLECHNLMVTLVFRMLTQQKQLAAAKTPAEKTFLQRQIEATDQEIDQLVYRLYDLTEDEIRIVEGEK